MASLYTSILGSIVTKRYGLKKGEKGNKKRGKRKAMGTIDASCSAATALVEPVETELKSVHDCSGVAVASASCIQTRSFTGPGLEHIENGLIVSITAWCIPRQPQSL